jgi:2-iminobutanoate/2-iminopropanoate deaminase
MRIRLLFAAVLSALLLPAAADAQVTRIKSNPQAIILDAAKVSAGTEMLFVSGQLPSPVDPNKPMADVKSIDELGDTKTQTISALGKIKKILESQGYMMSDTIKLSLFLAPDPRTGRMDFAGANEGFKTFFGTPETPVTVARSTFQVAALVGPYYLIEIEAIAAKRPK